MKKFLLKGTIVSLVFLFLNQSVFADSLVKSAPRPSINQGIDKNNALVLEHNNIYDTLLNGISTENTISNPTVTLNPYGTAPLSLYAGVWLENDESITVTAYPEGKPLEEISYVFEGKAGSNLIPVSGLVPDTLNIIILDSLHGASDLEVVTDPLPETDSATVQNGFVIPEVTKEVTDPSKLADGLYFVTHFDRYNLAVDTHANVRWYTSKEIPSFNFMRLSTGNFLASSQAVNDYLSIYEFDIMGRVHTVYNMDNRAHHSLLELPNNRLLIPSEYTNGRDGEAEEDRTVEDGISIIDLKTGLEVEYYDVKSILDPNRVPRPYEEDLVTAFDWAHINQSYIDTESNIIVNSSRHQGAIFGIDPGTGNLRFIASNHQDWDSSFDKYLLTPVDETGTPLYDLTLPADIERADKDFWTWGQHNVTEVVNGDPNILEYYVMDNGNYRSRRDENSVLPKENFTRTTRFKINLTNMTIEKVFEYGKDEVGNRGYSSYVSSQNVLDNGNFLVNFGAVHVDENGQILTASPGQSDLADETEGLLAMGKPFIQEIDPVTREVLFEIQFSSGYFKDHSYDPFQRYDVSCFRAYKMPLYKN